MEPNYPIRDTLPEFEEENAALSALFFEVSRKAPVHQIYHYKKDTIFNKKILKEHGKLLASTKSPGSLRAREAELWLYNDVYIYLRLYKENTISVVFINNKDDNGESVKLVFEEFEKSSKSIESKNINAVKVKFWSLGSYGPKYDSKFLELPTWADITKNYSEDSHESLQNLMQLSPSTLESGGKIILLHGPAGTGKALALDTKLLTPTGWTTMKDVQIGDELLDDQGNPCKVTFKSEIFYGNDCYEVKTDDGASVIADASHIWPVMLQSPIVWEKNLKNPRMGFGGPVPLKDGISFKTTRELAKSRSHRPGLNITKPINLPNIELPIDPYVLGVWLGDGDSNGGRITSSVEDQKWVRQFIEEAGYITTNHTEPINFGVLGLNKQLRLEGLLQNKHVPPIYLRASKEQRMALLQGLIDTDGYVEPKGRIEFTSTKRELADAVQFLARSLGVKASLKEERATLNGIDCGPKYRVGFYLEGAARLPRKALLTRDGIRTTRRYLTVTPVESVPTQCIQVDSPNHLFLCGEGLMITHNTTIIRALIREWKEWCDVEYIIDPEVILNSSNYLTQVVLGNDDEDIDYEGIQRLFGMDLESKEPDNEKLKSKYRLLIFEDTEELIASDDKGSVSASVSRLLNIGDGLLGQGLKILILITTNVKLEKLHPALVRPGRTLANIHVPKLSTEEATKWLGNDHKEATLAELYEEKSKKQIVAEQKEWLAPGTYL